jgi:chemotaxis protein methyltransferase CheR
MNKNAYIELIKNRLGINIHQYQTSELQKTVQEACLKFSCTDEEYLHLLKVCSDQSPLLEHLVAGITIGETYFFRDKNQMELLRTSLLPEIIQAKRQQGNLSLRIWSAGSASGEEIYTLAIMLYELLPDIDAWTLSLLGTDLNPIVLKKALAGCYSQWSMRSIDPQIMQRYFTKIDNHYLLSTNIRNLVKFDYLNLNDDDYPSIFNGTNAQDLILCRNVLIYFDLEHIAKLMHKLSMSLVPGGYLLLGASDPVEIKTTNLIFHHQKGILLSRPPIEQIEVPPILPLPPLLKKAPSVEKLPLIPIPVSKTAIATSDKLANAMALANLGKLKEAAAVCQACLTTDPTSKIAHFTYALTLIELNQLNNAENALRKALFLDREFVAAHYQLGLLLLRMQQAANGIKCLKNALTIAKTNDPHAEVQGYPGLQYSRLAEILEYELNLHAEIGKKHHESRKQIQHNT